MTVTMRRREHVFVNNLFLRSKESIFDAGLAMSYTADAIMR